MNEHKPGWYERAKNGPFEAVLLLPDLKRRVHKRLKEREDQSMRRPKRRRRWTAAIAGVLLIIAFLWMGGGDPFSPKPKPETVPLATEAANRQAGTVRAQGIGPVGKLLVVAEGSEAVQRLGAPSCFGMESDQKFSGRYDVIYTAADGSVTKIGVLEDRTFIQPNSEPVEMIRLPLQDADVFLLAPQYRDCHAIEIYAFAMDRGTGEAFPLSFKEKEASFATSYYKPLSQPAVRNNRLVLQSTEGPGGEGSPDFDGEREYRLDLREKALILE